MISLADLIADVCVLGGAFVLATGVVLRVARAEYRQEVNRSLRESMIWGVIVLVSMSDAAQVLADRVSHVPNLGMLLRLVFLPMASYRSLALMDTLIGAEWPRRRWHQGFALGAVLITVVCWQVGVSHRVSLPTIPVAVPLDGANAWLYVLAWLFPIELIVQGGSAARTSYRILLHVYATGYDRTTCLRSLLFALAHVCFSAIGVGLLLYPSGQATGHVGWIDLSTTLTENIGLCGALLTALAYSASLWMPLLRGQRGDRRAGLLLDRLLTGLLRVLLVLSSYQKVRQLAFYLQAHVPVHSLPLRHAQTSLWHVRTASDLNLLMQMFKTGINVEIAARPVRRGHRPLPVPAAPPPTAEALAVLMAGGSVQGAGAGRRPGGGWTALALAARHDGGAVTPEGVEAMTTLLRAQDRFFAPDPAREGVWRLTDQGQKLAARLLTGEGGERQPADQETVRARLEDLFGGDATYVRGSLYPQERRAVLRFHFPLVAGGRHADTLALVAAETGWSMELRQEPDMEALVQMVTAVLPQDVALVARPSVYHETRTVDVRLDRALDEEGRAAAERRYQEETGYTVRLSGPTVAATSPGPDEAAPAASPGMAQRVNAQTAIGAVRVALQAAGAEVYRVGQHGDRLQVTFLTPALAQRYQAVLADLAQRSGWLVTVDPQPQQQALIEVVRAVVRAPLAKGPGVHTDRQCVSVRLAPGVSLAEEERVA